MNAPASQDLRHRTLPLLLLAGDTLCVFAGLLVGYGLRYHTPLGSLFIEVTGARLRDYLPLLFLGTAFLLGAFAHLNLYDERLLLRRYQALNNPQRHGVLVVRLSRRFPRPEVQSAHFTPFCGVCVRGRADVALCLAQPFLCVDCFIRTAPPDPAAGRAPGLDHRGASARG